MRKSKVKMLSVYFNAEEKEELLKKISARIKKGQQTKIFTPNPQILLKAEKSKTLQGILNCADLSLPDGIGISIGARILNLPPLARISGIDFAEDLLKLARRNGYSVFLLGGKQGVAEAARKKLQKNLIGLNICGCNDGYFKKRGYENEKIIQKINKARPDILFVCFGCPAQEQWIYENLSRLPSVKIAIGLGGSLDVWSGNVKRAPKFMRRIGAEWLCRAIREPKRMRIFLDIPHFLLLVYAQKKSAPRKAKRSCFVLKNRE